MENRPLSLVAGLIGLALLAGTARAEDGAAPDLQADWAARLSRAEALRAESAARLDAADQVLEQKNVLCQKKILVTGCIEKNNREHAEAARVARKLENEGKAIEREVHKEQLSERDQQRLVESQQRASELPVRQEDVAASRSAAEDKAAAKTADQARKAELGVQRKAAEAAKHSEKQAAYAARAAEKMRHAEQRAAEAAKH